MWPSRKTVRIRVQFTWPVLEREGERREGCQPSVTGGVQFGTGKDVRQGVTVCYDSELVTYR